jgi:hypothetical protein
VWEEIDNFMDERRRVSDMCSGRYTRRQQQLQWIPQGGGKIVGVRGGLRTLE